MLETVPQRVQSWVYGTSSSTFGSCIGLDMFSHNPGLGVAYSLKKIVPLLVIACFTWMTVKLSQKHYPLAVMVAISASLLPKTSPDQPRRS